MSAGILRTLKGRIKSVENTKKITRAMEMVAAAKMRRFQDMMQKGQSFSEGLETLLKRLSGGENISHPFLEERTEENVALLFFSSDTGLCGSYNLDLFAQAEEFLKSHPNAKLITVGKMGRNYLAKQGYEAAKSFQDIRASEIEENVGALRTYLEEAYLSGEIDTIYTIYSHCTSAVRYEGVTQKLLPLARLRHSERSEESRNGDPSSTTSPQDDVNVEVDYIFEPDEKTILERLIPLFFESRTRQIFLEAFVTEQIARMNAMHQATENASEMIDGLVLQRNKLRQAIITKEIIEIVSGAQALNA